MKCGWFLFVVDHSGIEILKEKEKKQVGKIKIKKRLLSNTLWRLYTCEKLTRKLSILDY